MKNFLVFFLYLTVTFGYSQNKEYSVSFDHLFLADESKSSNTADRKIKLKFSSLDNGNYFVFNRLLFGNKTGKVLAYLKPYNTVVIRSQNKLSYLTFKEAFPKGGFYKTTKSKMIFGQQANLYDFDNDVLDIQLWVAPGNSNNNGFEEYLKAMGLLQNIPKDYTIIAVSILGVEFDISNFKEEKDKNFKRHLDDILVSFKESKDSLLACLKTNREKEKPFNPSGEKSSLSFVYKINSTISLTDSKGKVIYTDSTIVYANKENTLTLEVISQPNSDGISFIYTNRILGQVIEGTHQGNELFMKRGKTIEAQDCLHLKEKTVVKKGNVAQMIAGYDHEFGLFLIEKNTVDFPDFQNQTTSNGFLSKRVYINDDLEKQEYVSEIQSGTFNFNLEK
jgi:hypothetical protein